MIVGYARTSTLEQEAGLAAQDRDLRAAGAERIVSEQVSSVAERIGLEKCLIELLPGDMLMVTKPDRLARNVIQLLSIVNDLRTRGIGLVLLSMGGERIDTRNPTSKMFLGMMAVFAEFEREIMLERQREGIIRARAEGKYKGRRRALDVGLARALTDELGAVLAARRMGVAASTVYRALALPAGCS